MCAIQHYNVRIVSQQSLMIVQWPLFCKPQLHWDAWLWQRQCFIASLISISCQQNAINETPTSADHNFQIHKSCQQKPLNSLNCYQPINYLIKQAMSKNNELGTFSTFMGKKSGAQQLENLYLLFIRPTQKIFC